MDEQRYQTIEQQITPKTPLALNLLKAFLLEALFVRLDKQLHIFILFSSISPNKLREIQL